MDTAGQITGGPRAVVSFRAVPLEAEKVIRGEKQLPICHVMFFNERKKVQSRIILVDVLTPGTRHQSNAET